MTDKRGSVTQQIDAMGPSSYFSYDAMNRLIPSQSAADDGKSNRGGSKTSLSDLPENVQTSFNRYDDGIADFVQIK